jgi:TRAP-type C4-dicarboxylate transport system permease large subunit
LPWSELAKVLTEAGLVTGAILFLIVAASLYSRMLALSGIPTFTAGLVSEAGLGMASFLAIYLFIILLLGMILDSVSIMLMVLPVMLPIVSALGGNLVWFGVLTTISVEIGLLTPPFGISVFVVNSTLPKGFTHVREIFEGALPFVLAMMVVTVMVAAFPILATVIVR